MRKPLIVAFILVLAGCSTSPPHMYGKVNQAAQDVSVQELLGRPAAFDGKAVRVIGVVNFDFEFEGVSAIYTSRDDLIHYTNSYIGIASLATDLGTHKADLAKLSGKFALVEGIYHMVPRRWDKICIGECWPTGYLSDVNRAQAWYER